MPWMISGPLNVGTLDGAGKWPISRWLSSQHGPTVRDRAGIHKASIDCETLGERAFCEVLFDAGEKL